LRLRCPAELQERAAESLEEVPPEHVEAYKDAFEVRGELRLLFPQQPEGFCTPDCLLCWVSVLCVAEDAPGGIAGGGARGGVCVAQRWRAGYGAPGNAPSVPAGQRRGGARRRCGGSPPSQCLAALGEKPLKGPITWGCRSITGNQLAHSFSLPVASSSCLSSEPISVARNPFLTKKNVRGSSLTFFPLH